MAVSIGVCVSFCITVFSGHMPRSGIAGSHGSSIFNFWGASTLLSIVAAPIYLPTDSVDGFPFLRTLQQLLSDIFIFFNVASKSLFLIILQVNTAWGQQIKTGLREQIHPLDSRLKTLYWGIDFGFDLHRVVPEEFSLHCWVPLDGAGSGSFWIFFTILGTQIWRDRLSYLSHGLMPVRGGKEGYIWITDSKAWAYIGFPPIKDGYQSKIRTISTSCSWGGFVKF